MPAVEVIGLTKRFRRYQRAGGGTTLKSQALAALRGLLHAQPLSGLTVSWHTVLEDIHLVVPRGASLGIIGPNGCGKSTLLRLIAGIYQPDAGRVIARGRVAAMLELGAGFHPELSGRENARVYARLQGLSRREAEHRLNPIIEFSELAEIIDSPVRWYSSGQVMRLAFSVLAHLDPDVLLVDEALAVGDAAFVAKCHDRLARLRAAGKTLVIVTHDRLELVRSCDCACVMMDRHLSPPLDPTEAATRYVASVLAARQARGLSPLLAPLATGPGIPAPPPPEPQS